MNIRQLQYIVSVSDERHFGKAAMKNFVTQPTLSMMVRKLEEELGIAIFDRDIQPVVPTEAGEEIIAGARRLLAELEKIRYYAKEHERQSDRSLNVGIIPTLAPYLLPLFMHKFHRKHPELNIHVKEMVTSEMLKRLESGEIDAGILATPVKGSRLEFRPLFYEEFVIFDPGAEDVKPRNYRLTGRLDKTQLWLLEKVHCLRNQVEEICNLRKPDGTGLTFEAGSIETLINLADRNNGITIIPKLAVEWMKSGQKASLREFPNPRPAREISLAVTDRNRSKKLIRQLREEISASVPADMMLPRRRKVLGIKHVE